MMKLRSKFIAGLIVPLLVVPVSVFAQDGSTGGTGTPDGSSGLATPVPPIAPTDDRAVAAYSLTCSRIDEIATSLEKRIGEREVKLNDKKKERKTKLGEQFGKRDEKLTVYRDGWDDNRGLLYSRLEGIANTDAQKAAVAKFKTVIDAAVLARRSAVDKAISDFQKAVEAAVKEREGAIAAALIKFNNARGVAVSKAKSDCLSGVDARSIREALVAALKDARETLVADVKHIEEHKGALATLAEERKAAVAKAIKDFQIALEKAKGELKVAFPKPKPSPSPAVTP